MKPLYLKKLEWIIVRKKMSRIQSQMKRKANENEKRKPRENTIIQILKDNPYLWRWSFQLV